MSDLILPNQQPSRELQKAAGMFLSELLSQFPQMGPIIAPAFAIQVVIPTQPGQGTVVFSLQGNLTSPADLNPGSIPPLRGPKIGGT